MKIAIIAPPFLNVPPTKQGGTEAVLSAKIKHLVKLGHHVTLFHAGQSTFEGIEKVQIYPTAINDLPQDLESQESSRKLRLEMTYFALVALELEKRHGLYDVIFNHTRGEVAFAPLTKYLETPIISIFHLPILEENIRVLQTAPKAYAISISNNQRGKWANLPNFVATVYNGVEVDEYQAIEKPSLDFAFWIGTVGRHKNTIDAITAAKAAGIKLVMAGKIRDNDYYEEVIKPHIDGKNVEYLGEVDFETKLKYFQNAKALLFPTKWQEPFGLIMIEALSCGTPVIAYPNGAVPEVVKDGQVGYIVNTAEEMAEALKKVGEISRESCRNHAAQHFSAEAMTKAYLDAAMRVSKNTSDRGLFSFWK